MPNYDLGIAHGKIKITADTKGATDTEKELDALKAHVKDLSARFEDLEASLGSYEDQTHKTGKATNLLDKDLVKLFQTALRLKNAFDTLKPSFDSLRKTTNGFRDNVGIRDLVAATPKILLLRAGLNKARDSFLGLNKALSTLSPRTQNIRRVAQNVALLAGGYAILRKYGGGITSLAKKFSVVQKAGGLFDRGLKELIGTAAGGDAKIAKVARTFLTMGVNVRDAGKQVDKAIPNFGKIAGSVAGLITGGALLKKGLGDLKNSFAWIGKIPKQFIAIGAAVAVGLKPVTELGGKALIGVSNLAVQLFGAVKQLAGGFLAIPGAIAVAATAMGTATVLGKALGKTFKDVFAAETPEDLAAAIDALPEHLRGTGKALGELKKQSDDLGKALVDTFNIGLEDDVKRLTEVLQGPLKRGMTTVTESFGQARARLVNFLTERKNIVDMGRIFDYTAQVVDSLSKAFIPVAAGLRDVAIVGARFIRDLSDGAGSLTQKFADFAAKNRANGNLFKWMQAGKDGLVDLIKGSYDLIKALGSLLTLFATDNGDNALERYANAMKKFNTAVNASKAGGILHDIANAVKSFGSNDLKKIGDFFSSEDGLKSFSELKDVGVTLFKALEKGAKAFADRFADILKFGAPILNFIASMTEFFSPVIGKIIAMTLAFKGFLLIIGPLKAALVSLFAVGTITKFATTLNTALVALAGMGPTAAKLAGGIAKVANAALAMSTGFIGAAAAFTLVYLGITEGLDQIDEAQKAVDDSAKAAAENVDQLKKAFEADGGIAGKNVFTQVTDDMQEMQDKIQSVIDSKPGALSSFVDSLRAAPEAAAKFQADPNQRIADERDEFGNLALGDNTDQFKALEDAGAKAEKSQAAFDKLKLSTEDLGKVVTGSQSGFDALKNTLGSMGQDGTAALESLQGYRDTFTELQATFAAAGPGAAQVAAGIQAIADAGGDASAKLDGVKTALQGLGLLQTTAIEDAFNYAEAVREVGDKAVEMAAGLDAADKLLNDNGGFNTASKGAKQLYDTLQPVAEAFLRTAVSSGNADSAYQALVPQIQGVADAFKLSKEEVDGLLSSLGVDPQTVEILMQLTGKDQLTQNLASALLQAQAQAKSGINVPVILQGGQGAIDDVANKLQGLFGQNAISGKNAAGFTIRPDIVADPANLAKFQKLLADAGVFMPGGPPATPSTVPAAPAELPPNTRNDGKVPQPAPTGTIAPAPAVATPDTSATDAALAEVEKLKQAYAELEANPPKVDIDPAQFDALKAGTQSAVDAFNTMKAGIEAAVGGALNTVIGFASGVTSVLAGLAASAGSYGSQIGAALAAGLASQQESVQKAADGLAGAVAGATKPGSPTKRGPLSGQGWTGYSGAKLGKAFADSLASQYGNVQNAADLLAGGVAGPLNTSAGGNSSGGPGEKAGEFLGELTKLVTFGQHFVEAADKIGKAVLGFVKFISDPQGKGTFFGQSPGKAFGFRRDPDVSDADLQAKRDEKLQDKLQSPTKAQTPEEKAKEEQSKKDAQAQADLTASALDKVIAGDRVAPLSEEEKKAATDAKKTTDKNTKATSDGAKTQDELANASREQAANLSSYLDTLSPDELAKVQSGEVSAKTQEQMLNELEKQTPLLKDARDLAKNGGGTEDESIKALTTIQSLMDAQGEAKTPAQKQQMSALEGLSSTIKDNAGLTEGANPVDQAGAIAGAAGSIAGDIFKSIQGFIDAVGATKSIADTLVRGVANTEDIMGIIDDVQKFIQYAADIASTVGSIASAVGSFTGGADLGITSGVGQVASLVSGALEAVNATIDLAQEAYHIAGSYVGQFLGYLAGGSGSQLEGNVKYLLDEQTNQLLAYSTNNPQDKRVHDGIGGAINPGSRDQAIGTINVYGGPGSDPRDNTRQMMYQVRAAGFAGVGATSG